MHYSLDTAEYHSSGWRYLYWCLQHSEQTCNIFLYQMNNIYPAYMSRTATDIPSPQNNLGLLRTSQSIYNIQVPAHTVALDILHSKNAVAQVISCHSLQLVKVTSFSLSCSLFFLNYFIFYPPPFFFQLFLESWNPISSFVYLSCF